MTPPFLTFLLTLACCSFVALHSMWRFVLREQAPSLVHVVNCSIAGYASWLVLRQTPPLSETPDGRAVVLLLIAVAGVIVIHFFELSQSSRINEATGVRGVPYDGLFSALGGRWAPQSKGRKR